jgi:Na+-translocating ferredoxin:NAD+ oxidoreductase RnfD subunit
MYKQRRQARALVFSLVAAWFLFLIQPQIATIHHEHPGDEHAHFHADLLFSTLSEHSHDPHAVYHHSSLDEANDTHVHHTHPPARHPTLPVFHRQSGERGHWHTTIALLLTCLVIITLWLSWQVVLILALATESISFRSPGACYHPRAPPQFL